MSKRPKRVLLNYDKKSHAQLLIKHFAHLNTLKEVLDATKELGVTMNPKEIVSSSQPAFNVVAARMIEVMEVSLPNISPVKYLAMTDINTSRLSAASNAFSEYKSYRTKPLKSDFCTYLDKPEEVERYTSLKEICDTLNEWKKQGIIKNLVSVSRAMGSVVIADQRTMSFIPNTSTL